MELREGGGEVGEGQLEVGLAVADVALDVTEVLEDTEDDVAEVGGARVVARPVGQLVHHLGKCGEGGEGGR